MCWLGLCSLNHRPGPLEMPGTPAYRGGVKRAPGIRDLRGRQGALRGRGRDKGCRGFRRRRQFRGDGPGRRRRRCACGLLCRPLRSNDGRRLCMDRVCAFAISGTGVAPEQVIRTAKMTKKGLRRSFCTLWSCLSLFQGGYDCIAVAPLCVHDAKSHVHLTEAE